MTCQQRRLLHKPLPAPGFLGRFVPRRRLSFGAEIMVTFSTTAPSLVLDFFSLLLCPLPGFRAIFYVLPLSRTVFHNVASSCPQNIWTTPPHGSFELVRPSNYSLNDLPPLRHTEFPLDPPGSLGGRIGVSRCCFPHLWFLGTSLQVPLNFSFKKCGV